MKDPVFADDLSQKTRAKSAPVPPPPRKLVRKAAPSFFEQGLKRSTVLHFMLVMMVLLQPLVGRLLESKTEKEARLRAKLHKSAIRVDLVDLPRLKMDDLAKIDATLPMKPAPEKAPEKKAEPTPAPAPKPSETAMLDRTRKREAEQHKKEGDRLKALRDSMRVDNRRKELARKLKGAETDEETRAPLRGNIVSEGDSVTGDMATMVDAYNGKVKSHLRRNWSVPAWMTSGSLSARVLVKIGPDGRVLSKQFLKASGNGEFDSYVQRAIEQSDPFPAPPAHLARIYKEDGLEWGFPQ